MGQDSHIFGDQIQTLTYPFVHKLFKAKEEWPSLSPREDMKYIHKQGSEEKASTNKTLETKPTLNQALETF
jgi:hypothetical protein